MAVNNSPRPYFRYVQSLAGPFPRLQLLADFMTLEFRIKGYHSDETVARRMKQVDVHVIDLESLTPSPHEFNSIDDLSEYLNGERKLDSTRIILVESISTDVIELLGSRYRLDPRFFENYVRDIQFFLTDKWEGDKRHRIQTSMPDILQQNFFHLKYSRPYVFRGWEAAWKARAGWNVPRVGNQAQSLFMQEFPAMYGPVKDENGSSTFILLCDPLLDTALPEGIDLRNNDPLPVFDPQNEYTSSSTERKHISIRTTLENALLRSKPSTSSDTRTMLMYTILITALGFHAAAMAELSLRKYALDSNYTGRPKDSYRSMVERLNVRGGWMNLHEFTHKSMYQIKTVWIPSLPQGPERQSLEIELGHLEEGHNRVHRRQAQTLEFLRQDQEIKFTRSVERLTVIAFLFLPFSTMATILSIDDTMRFGVFFALAIPVSIICIAFGIRGTSLAEITARTTNLGKRSRLWFDVTSWRLFQFTRRNEAVVEPDLESRKEVAEFPDLYQKVVEAMSGHAEKSMSILIDEVESHPSLRQRRVGWTKS